MDTLSPEELKREGNRQLVAGDLASAEAKFRQLIRIAGDRADGYVGLAKVLERSDRFEEVVDLLDAAYKRFDSAQLIRQLGDAHRVLAERSSGSGMHLELAIRRYNEYHLRRRDPVTLFYLGHLLFDYKHDFEGALRSFRESWDLDPRSLQAYQGVIRVLQRLQRPEEVDLMKKLWLERQAERKRKSRGSA
jgi:tetratricopeptide (TPR) repeat protein